VGYASADLTSSQPCYSRTSRHVLDSDVALGVWPTRYAGGRNWSSCATRRAKHSQGRRRSLAFQGRSDDFLWAYARAWHAPILGGGRRQGVGTNTSEKKV